MQLIMTHEQADFDGLASLLGMALTHPGATAVLPRRMNRNTRSFINIFGGELPFTNVADLPAERVETIILVDTQSLVTIKGVNNETLINILDHHPRRPNLPENWLFSTQPVGACTTLTVELIEQQNLALNPIQASLLLLGIEEDTGSFTYASATPRDLRAAAFYWNRAPACAWFRSTSTRRSPKNSAPSTTTCWLPPKRTSSTAYRSSPPGRRPYS